MKPSKKKNKGFEEFCRFYEAIYKERWADLLQALQMPSQKSILRNPFAHLGDEHTISSSENGGVQPAPFESGNGLLSHYVMDEASILAASALPIRDGDRILDMCSAPGGKALQMIFSGHENCSFVLNERSTARKARLHRVIESYVPLSRRGNIKLTNHDATRWCLHEQNAYDAVLLDAPCSSERHLLEKPALLAEWSKSRSRSLAIQQFSMLASALAAVKPFGHLLYATCSISPLENDEVIRKLLKKRSSVTIKDIKSNACEKTEFGSIFLPDKTRMGPLFMCLLQRTA